MKELHLGEILIQNRRQRGVTQDELAEYMGVSRAAVSKWETGTTYPDILMLPRLASYFDLTIDELLGYEPQMDPVEIRRWYHKLSGEFASLPFVEALSHCRELIKKYFSCYPLLFQMGTLLVNHSMMAENQEACALVLEEAMELFRRVKEGTEDPNLKKNALQMEAYCLLALHRPEDVLRLLDLSENTVGPQEPLLASAFWMTGNSKAARRVLQVGIYQEILSIISLLSSYLGMCSEDPSRFEETCSRAMQIANAFHLDQLHPGVMLSCYIAIAQGWLSLGKENRALDALEQYTSLALKNIYPLRLHGDEYFDLLDTWLEENLDLGDYPPRSQAVIRRSITQALTDHPAFAGLSNHPRFQSMATRLRQSEEEPSHAGNRS